MVFWSSSIGESQIAAKTKVLDEWLMDHTTICCQQKGKMSALLPKALGRGNELPSLSKGLYIPEGYKIFGLSLRTPTFRHRVGGSPKTGPFIDCQRVFIDWILGQRTGIALLEPTKSLNCWILCLVSGTSCPSVQNQNILHLLGCLCNIKCHSPPPNWLLPRCEFHLGTN